MSEARTVKKFGDIKGFEANLCGKRRIAMKVKEWMVRELITITLDTSIQEAVKMMKENSIRHLPVVEDGRLIGLVTEGDMRQIFIASLIEDLSIEDVMIKDPLTITVETEIEDAARIIHYNKIGCLPVVDEDESLVGIITVADILEAYIELMGLLRSSSRIDINLGEDPDAFEVVSRIIAGKGGEIISVGISPHPNKKDRVYFFRLNKCNVRKITKELTKKGYRVIASIE